MSALYLEEVQNPKPDSFIYLKKLYKDLENSKI